MQIENYKHVYDAYGNLAAEQIKIFLESAGIETILIQESYGQTLGLIVGSLGTVQIYVQEKDSEAAEKLLMDMEEGRLEISGGNGEDTQQNEEDESEDL